MLKILQKPKKWFKRLILLGILLFVSFVILDWLIPLPIDDFKQRNFAQIVVDKNGQPLRAFPDSQGVWRYPVALSQVSPLYLQALINYEDRYYYQHFGVNPLAIGRAFWQWLRHGEIVSGASTLTMQVARILKPHKKSFTGKIAQMFRALQLEWHYSKDEILSYYINYAPFGGPIEGVQAASYAYFGKTASELSHSEAALLAVMPQAPSRYRPDRYPKRAQHARNKLLKRMLDFDVWTKLIVTEAKDEQVWAQYNTRPMVAPLLTRRLVKQYPKQQVIHSTIDTGLQTELEALVKNYIATKSSKMSAALLLVENNNMATRVYIGSADFFSQARAGHVDMIQANRSPGSTLKPFIYAMAFDQGLIHSESLLFDVPQSFSGYRPKNFSDSFHGAVSVSQSLGRSLNMPAVQLLNEITAERFYAHLKNSGLDIQLPSHAKPNLSLALGGSSVSMQQLLGAFSSLGRQGKAAKVRLTALDELIEYNTMSAASAWITQNILLGVSMKKIRSRYFGSQNSIAYKTGTSYGSRDAWVLASNKKFSIGIWLGQADGSSLEKNSGRQSAVPLLQQVLAMLPANWHEKVAKPLNISREKICWPLGTKQSSQQGSDCHQLRNAYLLDGTAPPSISDPLSTIFSSGLLTVQLQKDTGLRVLPTCWSGEIITKQYAVWPRVLEPWIAKPYRRASFLPKFSDECSIVQSSGILQITGIHHNSTIYPEASSNYMPDVQLKLTGSFGQSYWFVNGVLQQSNSNDLILSNLKADQYKITAIDASGNHAELSFVVEF
ncbi:Penicillin-insensitive transglycosylase & transpeptidase PBP-1C [hydrothermal vent metagenome]|uniref:peptidoglycan glycosyltransferase n=1 Tax=hydrothermal vent metagenome TaxID=652676 RepID=A0A3B0V8F8_9ZZZZ